MFAATTLDPAPSFGDAMTMVLGSSVPRLLKIALRTLPKPQHQMSAANTPELASLACLECQRAPPGSSDAPACASRRPDRHCVQQQQSKQSEQDSESQAASENQLGVGARRMVGGQRLADYLAWVDGAL